MALQHIVRVVVLLLVTPGKAPLQMWQAVRVVVVQVSTLLVNPLVRLQQMAPQILVAAGEHLETAAQE
jgi:hypothetical protein